MSAAFVDFAERLVPISNFSQGRIGEIFSDVVEDNSEYIVLRNNQPTAVLLPIKEYKAMQEKLARTDRLLEYVENIRLLQMAKDKTSDNSVPFEDLVAESGFAMEETRELARSVEFDWWDGKYG